MEWQEAKSLLDFGQICCGMGEGAVLQQVLTESPRWHTNHPMQLQEASQDESSGPKQRQQSHRR